MKPCPSCCKHEGVQCMAKACSAAGDRAEYRRGTSPERYFTPHWRGTSPRTLEWAKYMDDSCTSITSLKSPPSRYGEPFGGLRPPNLPRKLPPILKLSMSTISSRRMRSGAWVPVLAAMQTLSSAGELSQYFDVYAHPDIHRQMLADRPRTDMRPRPHFRS